MTPPAVTLRPAHAHDRDYLVRATELLADFPVPAWRTAEAIAEADRRVLLEALDHPSPENLIIIAERGGGPVGCLFATTEVDYFTGESTGHVEVVVVDRGAQGLGIGGRLLEAAETWARDRGIRLLTLNTFADNRRARAVYEHLGYREEIVKYLKTL